MEFEKEANGNLVINEENKKYTLVDMGCFVGYNSRQWYEESPSFWKLMFYDEKLENNEKLRIEALVDTNGDYFKITMIRGKERRIIFLKGPYISSDEIYSNGRHYSVTNQTHKELFDYLYNEQNFVSDNGETYNGNININTPLINFLNANNILINAANTRDKENENTL